METNKIKNSKSRRVVAGVAIAAAAFTSMGGGIAVVAPEYAAQAQAAESGIWKYEVVDDHVELKGLTDEGKQKLQDNGGKLPDFPLEIGGKKVTSIGNFAFKNNQITKLPDNWGEITSIGNFAFNNNQITSLPDDWGGITSIRSNVFSDNQITSLPDDWGGITSIGNYMFYNNKIASLPDDWGEITSIGNSAFSGNQITDLPDWGKITSIGNGVFSRNKITALPDDWGEITSIGYSAFSNNQITKLPDDWGKITSIGEVVFSYNPGLINLFKNQEWDVVDKISPGFKNDLQHTDKNPRISKESRCTRQPLNVALVFDTSESIEEDGIGKYKQSVSDFVDNVSDKGISLASFDFSDDANAPRHLSKPEPLPVTKDSKEKVKESLNEHFELKGTTNWESGLINVRDNNTVTNGKPRYDLVIFISDGFPNEKVTEEDITDLQAAQKVANQLKEQGSKVISMGVGQDLSGDPVYGLSNLLPLSGLRENNDYYLGDWDELASMLTHSTQNVTCGTQVDASAQIIDKDGKTIDPAAQGFEFSAEVTKSKHDNVTTVGEPKKTTPNALWSFPFNFNDKTGDDLRESTADITITQKPKDGFTFLNGEYKIVNNEDGKVISTGSLTGDSTVVKDVPADAHVQVVAKYHENSTTPDTKQSDSHNPGYKPAETTPGTAVDIEQTGDKEIPEGTKFGTPDKTPKGWEVKVDEKTGKVTATPPKDAKPGDKAEFTVPVTYPDGSKDEAPVIVTVKDDDTKQSDSHNPGYKPAETTPGTAVDIEQTGDKKIPDGSKFGTPKDVPNGWGVKVDEKTGKVTATPPKDAKPGDKAEFTVPVTYPDGSKDEAPVIVTVKDGGDNTPGGDPSAKPSTSKPGDDGSSTKPSTSKPGDDGSTSAKPSTSKPGDDGNPSTSKPGDGDPSTKPSDSKPGDDKPGDDGSSTKPSTSKPGDGKPGDDGTTSAEPSTSKPGDNKPGDDGTTSAEPSTSKPGDNKPGDDGKPSTSKPGDDKPSTSKPGDDGNPSTSKPGDDGKPSDSKPSDSKPGDDGLSTKPSDSKPSYSPIRDPQDSSSKTNSSVPSGAKSQVPNSGKSTNIPARLPFIGQPGKTANGAIQSPSVSGGSQGNTLSENGPVVDTGGKVEKSQSGFISKLLSLIKM